jgi:hypothetical protein
MNARLYAGLLLTLLLAGRAAAQTAVDNVGNAARAEAAREAIVVGVQQGISSLPPTSGQAFLYEWDADLEVNVATDLLAPISFRSPETVGAGRFALRAAASYFELGERGDELDPVTYRFEGGASGFSKLGSEVSAHVFAFNLALTFGVRDAFDVFANLPVTAVDADGASVITVAEEDRGQGVLRAVATEDELERRFSTGELGFEELDFATLARERRRRPDLPGLRLRQFSFEDDINPGIGRVSLGGKASARLGARTKIAFVNEIFLPSPHEDEYAGSSSLSVLPRGVAAVSLTDALHLHADAGYEHDFRRRELRRIVWNAGASLALARLTLDAGVGGSEFERAIRWTPGEIRSATESGEEIVGMALGRGNRLDTSYADVLFGAKGAIGDSLSIGVAASVPIHGDGLRPDASVTLSIEVLL